MAILATISLALGVATAVRVDFDGRAELLGVAGACIATGVAVAQHSKTPVRALGASAVASATVVALGQRALDVQSVAVGLLFWILLIAGIVLWAGDIASTARFTLLAVAGVALALPFLAQGSSANSPGDAIAMLAAIFACLAFGVAFMRAGSKAVAQSHPGVPMPSIGLVDLPKLAIWLLAGATAIAASISTSESWTLITTFVVTAAMLVDSITHDGVRNRHVFELPDFSVLTGGMAALVSAGTLAIASVVSGKPFGWPVAGAAFTAVACLFLLARVWMAESGQALERLRRSAAESRTDSLTTLMNRRGFEERLNEEIARATRYGHPISLLMIDVDDFKAVNDRFGHAAGDRALASVAAEIQQSIRTIDIAGRYGGEEFVVLLPETSLNGAAVVAERIRMRVAGDPAEFAVTVSIGVAEGDHQTPSRDALLEQADAALYRAKRSGKNQVELFR